MATCRLARTVALASFLGSASLVGGATFEAFGPEEAEAGYQVDNSYFYTSLAVHGSWVNNAQFGWVWYPHHRPVGWRPYTVGHWAWTDYGEWMWVSAEPYGWATYHYGRWFLDPFQGWVWIPGNVWAPAWVSWRDCDDYIGWAPLGPWGYWDTHYGGYRGWYGYRRWHDHDYHDHDGHHGDHDGDHDWDRDDWDRGDRDHARYRRAEDSSEWNFTRKRDFANERVDRALLDPNKSHGVFGRSRPLPPPSTDDERAGRGITRAVDRQAIERASGRSIRPVKIEEDKAPPGAGRGGSSRSSEPSSDRVRVFRPSVKDNPGAKTPDQLGIAKAPARGRGGSDDRSAPQARKEHGIPAGEGWKTDRERSGYQRPVRADDRGGRGQGGGNEYRMHDGDARRPSVERRTSDTQPRGHQVERYERNPGQAGKSQSVRSPYDAPTANQRRLESTREHQVPASRGGSFQRSAPSSGAARGGSAGGERGYAPSRPPSSGGDGGGSHRGYTGGNSGGSKGGNLGGNTGGQSHGAYQGGGRAGGSYGGNRGSSSDSGSSSSGRSYGGYSGGGSTGGYSGGGRFGGSSGGGSMGGSMGGGPSGGGFSHGGGGGMHR